jgi:Cu/Ag efflux pump CusA
MKILGLRKALLALVTAAFASTAVAEVRTLIELNGATPTAGLANSWKKVKDGEYQFTLDLSKEIGKGVALSAGAVKDSLETKLGSNLGVKVKEQSATSVAVTYTGDEAGFLAAVAKTKIRAPQNAQIALESSTSEGGIRANPGNRYPKAGEVKATVISVQPGVIVARVNDSKVADVKAGTKVKIKADGANFKPTKTVFFAPEKLEGDTWLPKAGSVLDR